MPDIDTVHDSGASPDKSSRPRRSALRPVTLSAGASVSLRHAECILATLREPFLVLDAGLRVQGGNRAFYDAYRMDEQQTEGRLLSELGHGEWDIPGLGQQLTNVLEYDRSLEDFEVDHDADPAGRRSLLLNARRIQPRDHDPELILLSIGDVTDRRHTERNLQESEARYRRLFYQAPDPMLLVDVETHAVLDANGPLCRLLGREADTLRTMALPQIGLSCRPDGWQATLHELRRNGYVRRDHLTLVKQGGEEAEVEFIGYAYAEGTRLIAQCTVRDRSRRPAMQEQMDRQPVTAADDARRKDEFLALLSHELRNPLAPIRTAVQLLGLEARSGGETPMHRQAREIIERQTENLTRLVGDLMDVSRILTGTIRLERFTVDLKQVILNAVETVDPQIRAKGHTLTWQFEAGPAWTEADPQRLEEVFINLLSNAAKYTPDGGRIQVTCDHLVGKDLLEVRVRDSGVGIKPSLLPRIFDLFIQAENTLTRSEGGLGLGLSIVQRIVGLHGGAVEVASPPAGVASGTEFLVRLPASRRA